MALCLTIGLGSRNAIVEPEGYGAVTGCIQYVDVSLPVPVNYIRFWEAESITVTDGEQYVIRTDNVDKWRARRRLAPVVWRD